MSQEQAKQFIERMKTNKAFRKKILAVESVAERLKLARDEGYECTAADLERESERLSDTDLAVMAGGAPSGCDRPLANPPRGIF